MGTQLSPKDWELISEYINGQLTLPAASRFENRLSIEPILKQGLVEMRLTRSILRSMPRRKPPHNFTLTRAQVDQIHKLRFLFPAFSFASAFSLILILVSLLIPRLPSTTPMMAAAPAAQESFKLDAQPSPQANYEAPSSIILEDPSILSPADGMGASDQSIPAPLMADKTGAISPGTPTPQSPPLSAPAAPFPETEKSVPPAQSAEMNEKSMPSQAPLPTLAPPPVSDQLDSTAPIGEISPIEKEGRMAATPIIVPPSQNFPMTASSATWPILRVILSAAAILFALAAFFVRKRTRS